MANWAHSRPSDADNSSGSFAAECTDWRAGFADSMSARTTTEFNADAGYTTADEFLTTNTSISLFSLSGSQHMKGLWFRTTLLVFHCRCILNATYNFPFGDKPTVSAVPAPIAVVSHHEVMPGRNLTTEASLRVRAMLSVREGFYASFHDCGFSIA